ncbi:pre-B-cell leukemia homeobox interacting protein 1b isoform X2 [Echeneis naucrates]|uniref:pre-B-cell leukemia homeobox interacting protein 1b isoform X2 n=1 Tax=Echeneis naucrates TaxID=173247 RepID=UPI0011135564|nr:pre-B-cell leukemia transcription factor-interacting protein 1-like isoform X2 [Echeneis naucrates]
MSGGSSANNSWTILTPEESVAETLRPLAEATEHHEENLASAAGSGANLPAKGREHLVSEEKTAEQSGDTSTEQHTSIPSGVTDATLPTSLEVSSSFVPGSDSLSQSEGLPKGPAQFSPDPDSFSDSYSHITPSPDEPPASILNTETLGGLESLQEEERFTHEGTFHPLDGKEQQQEGEQSDQSPKTTDLGNQADLVVDEEQAERTPEEGQPEVRRRRSLLAALERIGKADDEDEVEEEFQLPQREEESGFSVNKCILGAVILLGLGTIFFSGVFMDLDEESDYGARELKNSEVPGQQEWLNPEVPPPAVDVKNTEFLDKLAKGNQQISVLEAQLQAQREELKVAKGHAAEEAKEQLQWEEVEKENSRLKTEMASLLVLQKENERMKKELESVPALQKELETLRSALNELKHSAATEVPVKLTTSPPSGHSEDNRQNAPRPADRQARKQWDDQRKTERKEKYDIREKESLKEREKSEHKKDEQKERKDEDKGRKREQGKFDKEKGKEDKQKREDHKTKQWKEKDWKEDKRTRGDQGKPWRAREGKKEWTEKNEREDWKEEKDWKKARERNVKLNENKQWRSKEKKDGKDHAEKYRGKDVWEGEEVWKKGKDGFKGSGNEKDLKEKGEKKEWKKGGERRGKNGRDESNDWKGKGQRKQWDGSENHNQNLWKERKGKGERKQWNEKEWKSQNGKDDKEWKRKDERKQGNEDGWKRKDDNEWKRREKNQWENKKEEWVKGQRTDNRDWKKDRSVTPKHQDEHQLSGNHHHDHHEKLEWGDEKVPHTHRRPSLDQPEYWDQQRDRLQRNSKPPQHCNSLETCAQAEKLLPVPLPEFDAILQTYLGKAEEFGVDAFKRGELKKLATEFFKDGLFVHDQMSFQDFVEDVADILEDMVEGDENEEEDSGIEEEMEKFEKEVMKKFSAPRVGEKEERIKGEGRKESGRGRG